MPDTGFVTLRRELEASAVPPPFTEIRARRTRRSRRTAVASTIAALVASVAIGGVISSGRGGQSAAPGAASTYLGTVAFDDQNHTMYMFRGQCAGGCAGGAVRELQLYQSINGRTWTVVGGPLPGGTGVPVVAIGPLFTVSDTAFFVAIGGTIYTSTDGGVTWRTDVVDPDPTAVAGPGSGSDDDGSATALFTIGGKLFIARAHGKPVPIDLPSGASGVQSLSRFAGLTGQRFAVAIVATVDGAPKVYVRSGTQWIYDQTDPCPSATSASIATSNLIDSNHEQAPRLTVVCVNAGRTAADYRTSIDGGVSWSAPEDLAGSAPPWSIVLIDMQTSVAPYPAWVADSRGRVFRTTDGTHLIDIAPSGITGHATALYGTNTTGAVLVDSTTDRIYYTVNSGRTWVMSQV